MKKAVLSLIVASSIFSYTAHAESKFCSDNLYQASICEEYSDLLHKMILMVDNNDAYISNAYMKNENKGEFVKAGWKVWRKLEKNTKKIRKPIKKIHRSLERATKEQRDAIKSKVTKARKRAIRGVFGAITGQMP